MRVQPEEVDAIAGHLGMTGSAVRSRFLAASQDRLAEGPSSRCAFLSGGREATCEIYTVRPAKCRSWPYWPELRDNPAYLDRAASLCPGITLDPGSVDTPS